MGATNTVTLTDVPQPSSEQEFCADLQNDATFKQLTAGGTGTVTINSCSYSGNTGNISATVSITSPVALTVPYTVNYSYR